MPPALRLAVPLAALLVGVAAAGSVLLVDAPAEASASYDSAYGYDRTWNAALRLVRVDLGFKIDEKDDAAGYLMFEYKSPEGGKPTPGSMEFVRSKEPDAPVRVVVQLPQLPRYHEQVLIDSLAKKMRTEYGDPPARPKPQPAQPAPDGGADGGEGAQAQAGGV